MFVYTHFVKYTHFFHRRDTGTLWYTRGDFFYFFIFIFAQQRNRGNIWPKMNTIVFNKLSSQVLFEEKAKEVEMSSRNYLEVIDGQHPDLLSSNQTIRDNQAIRHRRSGYVEHSAVFCAAGQHVWLVLTCGLTGVREAPRGLLMRSTSISRLFHPAQVSTAREWTTIMDLLSELQLSSRRLALHLLRKIKI